MVGMVGTDSKNKLYRVTKKQPAKSRMGDIPQDRKRTPKKTQQVRIDVLRK